MTLMNSYTINNVNGFTLFALLITIVLLGTGFVMAISHVIAKYVFIKLIERALGKNDKTMNSIIIKNHLFHRIAYLIPAFVIYHFSYLFDFKSSHLTLLLSSLVEQITYIYILVGIALVLSSFLNCVNDRYCQLTISRSKPIKSYLQVAKIVIFSVTGILIASTIFNRSPMYFFTGVGATTALLAVVFKDSLMGFVASVQLTAYDMVRIGDWIEMPNFGADGEVMEISLNTVKVQNFDKTIVTIPSYALLTSGLKNWRGMHEAGGRRVKRGIAIDIKSIKALDESLLTSISQLGPLAQTAADKMQEQAGQSTNIGLFRVYLDTYLRQHPGVHKGMTILLREMQGTPMGLPLELYFFTNETDTRKYEMIQSDIIEHVYAIMPRFDLQAFQYVNG